MFKVIKLYFTDLDFFMEHAGEGIMYVGVTIAMILGLLSITIFLLADLKDD